tara:strand:- start:95 stop:484 length:390 start_codon:yes stop_codon:yes gene_type:complete
MIEVYLRPNCPYCDNTEMLLREMNLTKKELKIYKLNTEEQREKFKKKYDKKTFPQVYLNKISIGGNHDFVELLKFYNSSQNIYNWYNTIKKKYNNPTIINDFCGVLNEKNIFCIQNKKRKKKKIKKKTI